MVCKIADNEPLKLLRDDLGLASQCHSLLRKCIRGHEKRTGNLIMGIPGAALGYCQALFVRVGDAEVHTEHVINQLEIIDAPWSRSHELFWGNRQNESPNEFVDKGIRPLLGDGRVPILITELDPAKNGEEIDSILEISPPIFPGESVLLRLALSGDSSIDRICLLISLLIERARQEEQMPKWWPLLQGHLTSEQWKYLKQQLGDNWKYVNIAVNPFTTADILDFLHEQITVAQIAVGLAEGIRSDGQITLAKGMVKLTGADDCPSYSLPLYMQALSKLDSAPTLIVLGPSLLEWSDEINRARLSALKPLIYDACRTLWNEVKEVEKAMILKMSA